MSNDNLAKVFRWFGLGLLVTFLVAYVVSTNEAIINFVFSGFNTVIIVILELVCAFWLTLRINKMSTSTAITLYFGYTALTGLTLSSIFLLYELTSIIWIFLVTSLAFGLVSLIAKSLKINLSNLGIFLLVGLIAVILLEVINIFIMNSTLDIVLCIVSLLIFVGYVFYDIQVICRMNIDDNENVAIIGAFNIYLDFINIFLQLLSLFGKRDD